MTKIVGHTKEDVSTLPRWARMRIERLTAEIERQTEIALSTTIAGKTNVVIVVGHTTEERSLPNDSHVRFRTPKGDVEISHRNDAIEVRARDGVIIIRPEVSNVIRVTVSQR